MYFQILLRAVAVRRSARALSRLEVPVWQSSRTLKTNIPCPLCSDPLTAERACRAVSLHCARCNKHFALRDFMDHMDDALEAFVSAVPCDRV